MEGSRSPGHALWLAQRRQGIGGSDVAAVLGLSKFKSPYEVWLEKTAALSERKETPQMRWGRRMEAVIADQYAEQTGYKLTTLGEATMLLKHPEHDFLIATPDRLVPEQKLGVEIKRVGAHMAEEWGREGSETVPLEVALQALHYMAVTGFARWDIAALIGDSDFRIYPLRRDVKLEAEVVGALKSWWEEHVLGGVPPPLDSMRSTSTAIARRFPRDTSSMIPADTDCARNLAALETARARREEAEENERLLENLIKAFIGEHEGVEGEGYRVTWRAARPSTVVDWKMIAERALDALSKATVSIWSEEHDGTITPHEFRQLLFDECSSERPGSRRFLFKREGAK